MKRINSLLTTLIYTLFVTMVLILPYVVNAQIEYTVISPIGTYDENGVGTSGITSLEGLIVTILNILIVIATPIIVLFIIYAGFLYVTAKGNAEQVKQATQALTYAIIGGVLIIGAVALSQVIANVVGAFRAP